MFALIAERRKPRKPSGECRVNAVIPDAPSTHLASFADNDPPP